VGSAGVGVGKGGSFRQASRSLSEMKKAVMPIQMDLPFKTVHELQIRATEAYGPNPMFGTYKKAAGQALGEFEWVTFSEFDVLVQRTRNMLKAFNVGLDDKVSLISNNRTEWAAIKYAANGLGAQLVPMYEAQMEKDWLYILEDSDAKLVIVATEAIYNKTADYPGRVGKVESVISLEAGADKTHSYQHWMQKVRNDPPVPALGNIPDSHISTIIYTSGTTGNPKGVELSHRNICSDVHGANNLWKKSDMLEQQTSLAFLPWAHVFGLTCELHQLTATGSARAIVPNREMLLECLGVARPTAIISVPVLFNRVYDGVMKTVSQSSPLKQALVKYALSVARRRNHALEFGKPVGALLGLQFKVLDKVVLSKIRDKLGGRLKSMAAGGAATSLAVLEFFEDIGIPITEGYGLTETSPIITLGTVDWKHRRLGCVGVEMPGAKVRIIDPDTLEERPQDTDGEITCKGDMVMTGYRKNKKANEEVFYYHDGDKYFRTGDLGKMVEGKFLKITGRIKEQFKLENGKYVVPAPLEDAYSRSPYVGQIFICGDNQVAPVALVVPSYPDLSLWYAAQSPPLSAPMPTAAQLADPLTVHVPLFDEPAFVELITAEMVRVSTGLKGFEKPVLWQPIAQAFAQENQMLTPKMSLRRVNIVTAYGGLLKALYEGKGHAVRYKRDTSE